MKISLILLLSLASTSYASIYGEDNRRDIYQETNPKFIELSKSVAGMVNKSRFKKPFLGKTSYQPGRLLRDYPEDAVMCEDEAFLDQEMIANCTGVLVAPDKILTSYHCMNTQQDCAKFRWVFDVKMKDEDQLDMSFISEDNIYECKGYAGHSFKKDSDYIVVQLDRPVAGRTPVTISRKTLPLRSNELMVIGHPLGLPLKIADQGYVLGHQKFGYSTNLDSYLGNSGAPVFDKSSGEVIGLISSGKTDFHYDPRLRCVRSNRCTDKGKNCDISESYLEYVIEGKNLPTFEQGSLAKGTLSTEDSRGKEF